LAWSYQQTLDKAKKVSLRTNTLAYVVVKISAKEKNVFKNFDQASPSNIDEAVVQKDQQVTIS
jgi:hypothetical protein